MAQPTLANTSEQTRAKTRRNGVPRAEKKFLGVEDIKEMTKEEIAAAEGKIKVHVNSKFNPEFTLKALSFMSREQIHDLGEFLRIASEYYVANLHAHKQPAPEARPTAAAIPQFLLKLASLFAALKGKSRDVARAMVQLGITAADLDALEAAYAKEVTPK